MDKVKLINPNLHTKFFVGDSCEVQENDGRFLAKTKIKQDSNQEKLKIIVKKGIVHFVNPFIHPKSGLNIHREKENRQTLQMRYSHTNSQNGQKSQSLKNQHSSGTFSCSKNHELCQRNTTKNYRFSTESYENLYLTKKKPQTDWDDPCLSSNAAFKLFKNISEETINRISVQNERKMFKLDQIRTIKYDRVWKKYPVPSKKSKQKQKMLSSSAFHK